MKNDTAKEVDNSEKYKKKLQEIKGYLLLLGNEALDMEKLEHKKYIELNNMASFERWQFFRGRRNAILQIYSHVEGILHSEMPQK